MRHGLIDVLYTYKNAFSSDNEPLGDIKGNEVDIILNIDRPYPPVLRRPAYPASPRAREALEKYIQEIIQLGVLRKYITSMDALKGFHQNVSTPKTRKSLRTITHCGIYEYLRMPFGIKNVTSHYQRMMNTILPTELSEGWFIIYIDDIIICFDSWSVNLKGLARVPEKTTGMNMKI
ncbi:hypothetical protein O181_001583 [Austropuccinia psidii MF-1]|uniref:Reverse transcriptase domain-containing protein n=1 Tax=Austropuccinia psidii MF-1 TaxID=1389203 RepID=A0A9Q3BAT6_9BASI|nr:hypothetical protein [Austropuccinia psidii MF-1]